MSIPSGIAIVRLARRTFILPVSLRRAQREGEAVLQRCALSFPRARAARKRTAPTRKTKPKGTQLHVKTKEIPKQFLPEFLLGA